MSTYTSALLAFRCFSLYCAQSSRSTAPLFAAISDGRNARMPGHFGRPMGEKYCYDFQAVIAACSTLTEISHFRGYISRQRLLAAFSIICFVQGGPVKIAFAAEIDDIAASFYFGSRHGSRASSRGARQGRAGGRPSRRCSAADRRRHSRRHIFMPLATIRRRPPIAAAATGQGTLHASSFSRAAGRRAESREHASHHGLR